MKLALLLLTLSLASPCLTAPLIEAYEAFYFFLVYDMDVRVWGPGQGYVATRCRSPKDGGRCNYNEFVTFIVTGDTTSTTEFYKDTVEPGFAFVIADVIAITEETGKVLSSSTPVSSRIIEGRKSMTGIWKDMGFVTQTAMMSGALGGMDLSVQVENTKLVLGGVSELKLGIIGTNIRLELMREVKGIAWQSLTKSSDFSGQTWEEVDWERTVILHPTLQKPNTALFNAVKNQLASFYSVTGNTREMTAARKILATINTCFG